MQERNNIQCSTIINSQEDGSVIIQFNNIIKYFMFIIVIIYIEISNPQVTNTHFLTIENISMLVGTSETVRMFSNNLTSRENAVKIRQWIAGIVDGDGHIYISKKGYCTIEISIEIRDIACLSKIKNRYGGSIKSISNGNAFRYRLHHKEGIIKFICDINGIFYNPTRIIQFNNLCNLYNITVLTSPNLIYNNAYLSGLFDSDGSIYINLKTNQIFVTISQKNRYLLDLVCSVYGGKVYSNNANKSAYKWTVFRKEEVINLIDNYFHWNNCVSAKNKRFKIIKIFYIYSNTGVFSSKDTTVIRLREKFIEEWKQYHNVDYLKKRQSTFFI